MLISFAKSIDFNILNTSKISTTLETYTTSSSSYLTNIDIANASTINYTIINIIKPNLYYRDYSKLNN